MLWGVLMFVGFESAGTLGEETQSAKRNIPIALFTAVIVIGAYYVLAGYVAVVGYGIGNTAAFQADGAPWSTLAGNFWGSGLQWVIEITVLNSIFANLLSGCTAGPDYQRPAVLDGNTLPAAFTGAAAGTNAGEWKTAQPSAHLSRGAWWESFGDAELNRLVALAATNNQDLAGALARFEQARALVTVARADFFPHISAAPGYARQRSSANQFERGHLAGAGYNYDNFSVPLDATWEADLWSRVRRQVEAARARLTAAAADVEALKLTVEAEVIVDYFALQALRAEHGLLQQTVGAYRRSLELTRNRRAGGIVSDLDVAQAETQLKAAEAQLPAVDLQRTQVRHALARLCGQSATGFEITAQTGLPANVKIPASLPSELLERRPDIAAAERRMAAANAEIGVAQTAFYPRLVFKGLAGFQSIDAGTLFDWPSRFWAIGPTLELPLFTGGRNRARLAAARAGYDAAVAGYRQTVLTAFQEVEDQLAAQTLLAAQLDAQLAALAAARRTLEIADNRYQSGLVTYLEVATAQSAALSLERVVVRLQAERLAASGALAKALGGGWPTVGKAD